MHMFMMWLEILRGHFIEYAVDVGQEQFLRQQSAGIFTHRVLQLLSQVFEKVVPTVFTNLCFTLPAGLEVFISLVHRHFGLFGVFVYDVITILDHAV